VDLFYEPADRYTQSQGLRLHYVEWGDPKSETLFLIHGNRDQARSWDFFVTDLLKRHRFPFHVVALDLRGHGDSEWNSADSGYHHEDFLHDLSAVFRSIGKESVSLIGHSMGGSMAVLFTACFPERVKRLVLLEAVGPFARKDEEIPELLAQRLEGGELYLERTTNGTLEEAAGAVKKRFPLIPDAMCGYMARFGTNRTATGLIWKHDPRLRLRSSTTLSEGQIRAFIRRINCSTLIVYGSESGFTKSARAPRLDLFPNAQIVEVPGAGHHIPHERPAELAKIVSNFLAVG
jgi:pimeloyl-ACP methyl ester carboxylesterase